MITEINKAEALRYMGHRGEIPKALEALVLDCEKQLLKVIRPNFTYKICGIEKNRDGISVNGTSLLLCGKDIEEHLDGCDRVVLLCATLGSGVDALIRRTEITDMARAFALDALASAAIEQVCAHADEALAESLPDMFLTWRFSPGYGDFPLEIQGEFLKVLDASKRLGLCTTQEGILIPRKSVTAVAGVSDKALPQKKRGCASCNMVKNCQFRTRGEHCGF